MMSISNLNQVHLTAQQMEQVQAALSQLENALKSLVANLTAEQRSELGRINEQNKLFVNKINDFATSQPQLRSPDVDWEEFAKDFATRSLCETLIQRLETLTIGLKNRKTLGDYDNYQDALNDYAYTNYKVGSKSADYENKQRECKQFFARTKKNLASEN